MGNRNVHSPSGIYGIRPGFNIADLDPGYSTSFQAITNATTNTTSAPIDLGCRSASVYVVFQRSNTSCDVIVTDGNSNVVGTFLGVNYLQSDMINIGGYEGIDLASLPFTVTIQNIVNPANINVFIKKTS
jgi:hypothetical protein